MKNWAPAAFQTKSALKAFQAEMQKALTEHQGAVQKAFMASQENLDWLQSVVTGGTRVSEEVLAQAKTFRDFLTLNNIERVPIPRLGDANALYFGA